MTVALKKYLNSCFNLFQIRSSNSDEKAGPQPNRIFVRTPSPHTVLTPDVVLFGNISSESDITVLGEVQGDVFSTGDIEVCGRVTGNVNGKNICVHHGYIHGNVEVAGNLCINEGEIRGDVSTGKGEIDGLVCGNIEASESLSLRSTAIVLGDISTPVLQVEQNGKVRGSVSVMEPGPDGSEENLRAARFREANVLADAPATRS